MRSRHWWSGLVFVGTTIAASLSALPATAQVDVVVDSGPVKATKTDGGAHQAKVALLNLTDEPLAITAGVPGDRGCVVTAQPERLRAASRSIVTLDLGTGCDIGGGANVRMDLGGSTLSLAVEPPARTEPDWSILWWAMAVAGFACALVLMWVPIRTAEINHVRRQPPPPGAKPAPKPIAIDSELELGSSWSFKTSWVSNVTLGAAAVVGLLAATDVLEAVLGAKPTAALGLLAVAAGISAICVTIGPLILMACGTDRGTANAGGTVAAGIVVVFGSVTQIFAVTFQATRLTEETALEIVLWAVGIATLAAVGLYAARSLVYLLDSGTGGKPASTEETPEAKTADVAPEVDIRRLFGDARPPAVAVVALPPARPERDSALI